MKSKSPTKSHSTTKEFGNFVHVVEPIPREAMAKTLQFFSVTADSVVATAILVFDETGYP